MNLASVSGEEESMADIYAFLELDGVEGESQDSEYQKKIEVQSIAWGGSNNSSFHHGTGSGIGKGHIHEIGRAHV